MVGHLSHHPKVKGLIPDAQLSPAERKCYNVLIIISNRNTMVEHLSHHPKFKGLIPGAKAVNRRDKRAESFKLYQKSFATLGPVCATFLTCL
jgi:hypothetical protein